MVRSAQDDSVFVAMSSKIIQKCGSNDVMARKAVLTLTDVHKRDMTAMRVGYERTIRDLRAALQQECATRQNLARTYQDKLNSIAAASRSQEHALRTAHERELVELRAQYESVQSAQKYEQSIVAQLHHDHSQELARVKETYAQTLANREKEVALLQRRVAEEMEVRQEARRLLAAHYSSLTEEAAARRVEVQELRASRGVAQSSERDALSALVHTQSAVVHSHQSSLNTMHTQRAEVEVHLSRLRSLIQQFVTPLAFNSQLAQSLAESSSFASSSSSKGEATKTSNHHHDTSWASCSHVIIDSLCARERKGQEMLLLINDLVSQVSTQLETISQNYQACYRMHADALHTLHELMKQSPISSEFGAAAGSSAS